MSELFHMDHILGTSIVSHIIKENEGLYIKLKDCIMSSIALTREWEKPGASNTRWRVLSTYIRWLLHFSKKLHIDLNTLENYLYQYEILEFGHSTWIVKSIMEYLVLYEKDLKNKEPESKEEVQIKRAL